jgi:hypothetical protein
MSLLRGRRYNRLKKAASFEKKKSGNPSGRPPAAKVREKQGDQNEHPVKSCESPKGKQGAKVATLIKPPIRWQNNMVSAREISETMQICRGGREGYRSQAGTSRSYRRKQGLARERLSWLPPG